MELCCVLSLSDRYGTFACYLTHENRRSLLKPFLFKNLKTPGSTLKAKFTEKSLCQIIKCRIEKATLQVSERLLFIIFLISSLVIIEHLLIALASTKVFLRLAVAPTESVNGFLLLAESAFVCW